MTTGKKKTDSPSDSTETIEKRLDNQEALSLQIVQALKDLNEKLDTRDKLVRAEKPEAKIAAMKETMNEARIGLDVDRTEVLQLDKRSGFQKDDIIILDKSSEKYAAYRLDENGEPVGKVYQYECQACPNVEEYIKGPDKKLCPTCHNAMIKKFTGKWQEGTPAYGIVINYMYTDKRGKKKYKVYFEKFSEGKRGEGLRENEMVLCK